MARASSRNVYDAAFDCGDCKIRLSSRHHKFLLEVPFPKCTLHEIVHEIEVFSPKQSPCERNYPRMCLRSWTLCFQWAYQSEILDQNDKTVKEIAWELIGNWRRKQIVNWAVKWKLQTGKGKTWNICELSGRQLSFFRISSFHLKSVRQSRLVLWFWESTLICQETEMKLTNQNGIIPSAC